MSASYRFALNIAERNATNKRRITGISNGDVRNRNLPSMSVFIPKTNNANEVKKIKRNCFGRTNASVVVLKKKRGKRTKRIPTINSDKFSK